MVLLSDCQSRVLTLTLNRPERLNAIDAGMARALLFALDGAQRSHEVKVVVLRGNGRAFCAGRDVTEAPTPEILDLVQRVSCAIVECSKPVVVAVQGWAVGTGVERLLDADAVVAARGARFKLPEAGIGVFVTGGVTATMPAIEQRHHGADAQRSVTLQRVRELPRVAVTAATAYAKPPRSRV